MRVDSGCASESKLIRAFFTQIGVMLEELASTQVTVAMHVRSAFSTHLLVLTQVTGHRQLTAAWQQVQPIVEELVTKLDVTGFK